MGEKKTQLAKRKGKMISGTTVQPVSGRLHVRWDEDSTSTPMGQLAYFIEFMNLTGLWDRWLTSCPLSYRSPNAPVRADVLGTWLLSVLSGHRRYAHVTAIRGDGVTRL